MLISPPLYFGVVVVVSLLVALASPFFQLLPPLLQTYGIEILAHIISFKLESATCSLTTVSLPSGMTPSWRGAAQCRTCRSGKRKFLYFSVSLAFIVRLSVPRSVSLCFSQTMGLCLSLLCHCHASSLTFTPEFCSVVALLSSRYLRPCSTELIICV
jgi:hypothetical protein